MGANQVPKLKNNNFYVIRHSGFPDRSNFAIDRRYGCLQYETAWAWERVGRGKLLLRSRLLGGARRFGANVGGRGRGHIMAAARPPTACIIFDIFRPLNGSHQAHGAEAFAVGSCKDS